jgi:hypothetical protein
MKANYDHIPLPIEPVGDGSFLINYNIEEITNEGKKSYNCDQAVIWNEPTKDRIISAIIRESYTQDQAEAIIANYLDGRSVDEYANFQTFRKTAKSVANSLINII